MAGLQREDREGDTRGGLMSRNETLCPPTSSLAPQHIINMNGVG